MRVHSRAVFEGATARIFLYNFYAYSETSQMTLMCILAYNVLPWCNTTPKKQHLDGYLAHFSLKLCPDLLLLPE